MSWWLSSWLVGAETGGGRVGRRAPPAGHLPLCSQGLSLVQMISLPLLRKPLIPSSHLHLFTTPRPSPNTITLGVQHTNGECHKHSVQNPWLAKVGDQSRREEVLLQTLNEDTNRALLSPPSQVPHTGEHTTQRKRGRLLLT